MGMSGNRTPRPQRPQGQLSPDQRTEWRSDVGQWRDDRREGFNDWRENRQQPGGPRPLAGFGSPGDRPDFSQYQPPGPNLYQESQFLSPQGVRPMPPMRADVPPLQSNMQQPQTQAPVPLGAPQQPLGKGGFYSLFLNSIKNNGGQPW